MSHVLVDNITNREGGAIGISSGAVVTGVVTATSFVGDGSGLSGIDATALKDSGGSVKVQGNTSGIVVTGVSTFTGNVSVGGVITYEDVTSIDSVGVITARDGIKIGAGQSVSAVSGIVTYYGDGSKLSGVESGVVNFVASGDIGNGQTVIIKTDGTASIVAQTGSANPSAGTPVLVASLATYSTGCAYDSTNNKVIVAYRNLNSDGRAKVGTVSGTNITFGSETTFNSGGHAHYISCVYDSTNEKVVIAYTDSSSSSDGTAIVGTVSGTSISFGTKVAFETNNIDYITSTFDSTNGKVVIAYSDNGNGTRGTALVGTVSGTSISYGAKAVFNTGSTGFESCTYDSTNGKVVIAYRDQGNSNYGTAVVGTVSGTSISFGSEVVFESENVEGCSATYDSTNQKVVIAYKDNGNSSYGTAIVGTVSGTSISFGTAAVFNTANTNYSTITFDSTKNKVVIVYNDAGNSNRGTVINGTVSGTSISFSNEALFNTNSSNYISCVYDSTNEKTVVAYQDAGNSSYVTSAVITTDSIETNLTAENYIGIAAEAISNGATGKINVVAGTNTGQTGLTTAQKYFVQTNGTLGTSAGDPSVVAGTAISDTKIVVR
jgi:hypothetical protein